MKAIWNGIVIAESIETITIEGNHYFSPSSVNMKLLQDTATHTVCPWKGEASYYSIVTDGKTNIDAAWYYREPKELAKPIKDFIAFWRGVEIIK